MTSAAMLIRILALAVALLAPPAGAETLWRGDFSGDWMARWNVVHLGKRGADLQVLTDDRLGAFVRVGFPAGEVKEGFSFRAEPVASMEGRETVYLSYWLRFSPGFEWQRGGKLPGLMTRRHGSISGCRQPDGTGGFSARYTWGRDGAIRLYPYVPPQAGYEPSPRGCARARRLHARLETGRWINLVQMVRLNTPGRADGMIRTWIDGAPAGEARDLRLRDVPFGIGGILFATFYGGRCCAPEGAGNFIDFAAFSLHDANPLDVARPDPT